MKARGIAASAAILLLCALLTGCGAAGATTQTFRLAEGQPEGYPTTVGDEEFARLVEKRTDGRVRIEVYDGGQLGQEAAVLEQVSLGAVDFARVNASPLSEFAKPMGVYNLPYVFDGSEHMWAFLNGKGGEDLLGSLRPAGMVGLAYYDSGARNFYTAGTAVERPQDLQGLKIRVQKGQLNVALIRALGASATPMDFGEVYSALQTGVIDGAENNWPSYLSTAHYEIAPNFILSEHTRIPEVLLASEDTWEGLSPGDREIVRQAAEDSVETQRQAWDEAVREAKREVREAGANVVEVDKGPWRREVEPLLDSYRDEYGESLDAVDAARPEN